MKNDNVISPGIFRINPFKASRIDNFVPNKHVKPSVGTKPITVSQPHVITKNDKVPSKSKSRRLLKKLEQIEENHRNLQCGQNWFDTLLIPLLSEYKPMDKEDHGDNECVPTASYKVPTRIDEEEVATKRVSSDTEDVRLDEGEVAAERASEDTEEMATVLTTMDAATVLASRTVEVPTGSGSIPTAGPPVAEVPTSSDVVPTASPVFATATAVTPYRRRKGKEVMDQRRSEQIARDEEIARIHAEEELQIMIDGLDRSNEVISKHLAEYEQVAADLTIRERIELINELVKYQDHHSNILQYQAQQKNPRTKKQKRDFYMAVIRNNLGWKAKDFKGMSFEEVEEKFKTVWEQIEEEVPKEVKSSVEVPKQKIKEMMQLVPIEVYVEALQVKHHIIDWEVYTEGQRAYWKIIRLGGSSASYQFFTYLLKHLDRYDFNQLWSLVKETLSKRPATSDKEMELWVELSRLYDPNVEDQLWTHTQNFMHALAEWKFYDKCRVRQLTSKDKDIFMLVEKDYPLRKGLALRLLSVLISLEDHDLSFQQVVSEHGKFEQWQFRMQQYLQHKHYALWEVIEFGDSYEAHANDPSTTTTNTTSGEAGTKSGRTVTLTTEDMQKKKNDATILKTFSGNEATKKTKKNLLKQQYGNFRAEGSETLEQTFTRLQVIVGQLQFMDVEVEQDDLNQKGNDEVNTASVYTTSSNVPTASVNVATKDLSWTGLPECADDIVTDYSRPSPTVESSLEEDQNINPSVSENVASPITPKPFVKFVKASDSSLRVRQMKRRHLRNNQLNMLNNIENQIWNFPPVNRKFSIGSRNFPTVNRKFSTASRKFPTGSTKNPTLDMGMKGKAVKPSTCWSWKPSQNLSYKGLKNNSVSVMFKKYTYINTQGRLKHMTGNISYLSDYEPFDGGYVSFGQGGCKITGKGTIKIGKLEFKNVYFVKDIKYNLFSVSQICDNKNSVLFTESECIVLGRDFKLLDDDNVLLRTLMQYNMYSIDLNNIVPHRDLTCLVAKASADECMIWHRRLGHLNFKTMNKLVRHNLVRGLPTKCFENDHNFTACLKGKQHKASCKSKLVNSVSKPLHTLHMDLFGPTSDETSDTLKKFITEIENLKDLKVKIIRCDNGGEFRNKELNDFCSQKGIKREFSNARTPQQNGVAERRNMSLIEATRTMLADAKLPVTFWAEVVNTTCYVQNRVLVNKAHNKTPYELFNGRTPAIGFLKPFGCYVMTLNTLDNLGKFEAKGDEGYFLGYSMSSKVFRVFNKRTKRVEENLHIEFLENKAIEKGSGPNWLFDIDSLTKSMNYVPVVDAGTNSTNFSGTKVDARQDVKKDVSSLRYILLPKWVHEEHLESPSSQPQDACNTDAPKSSGKSNPTATSINPLADQLEILIVETPIPTFEDILGVTTYSKESSGVKADVSNMETTITASPTPTLRIHMDHPKSQIISHVDTSIQTRNKSKEVLKNKKDERGIVIRNKAMLVAQGHTQEEGIDYDEVFTPVTRIEAIRLFLAYASFMGFIVYQMDVKSAFLYGTIDEEVYVIQPPGFQDPEYPARVYKVEKAIGTIDRTLFIRRQRGDFILVQVYVDDIIFESTNLQLCREFEALMHENFQMSAMGELNFFLGLQVLQKEDGIFLSQDKYVGDILKKFGYLDVRSSNTPMDKENPWGKDGTGKDVNLHLYRSMIGSLMYLTASRPDIMFAVCACARHQVTPKECHLHTVKRIFRYLKGHPKLGLWYPKDSLFDLVAYSDSDYGGATQDHKSTTGGC
nr:putative ribonuclease H-like domain-containing protein [Tanacetum cinerariifolium]